VDDALKQILMYFHSKGAVAHALRDPFLYREEGKQYLFYAVAGEHGIALAEVIP
jgi:hypothetical protein